MINKRINKRHKRTQAQREKEEGLKMEEGE